MMNNKPQLLIVLLFTSLLTSLFYKQFLGLNLFIAESAFFLWLAISKQIKFGERIQLITVLGFMLTGLFTVITFSAFSIASNFMAMLIFVGVLIYPETKSLITAAKLSFLNAFSSQFRFLKEISNSKFIGNAAGKFIYKMSIIFIPLIIVFFFLIIYSVSNPIFDSFTYKIQRFIADNVWTLFKDLNYQLLFTFIFFLLLSNFLIMRTKSTRYISSDQRATDELTRTKQKSWINISLTSLKTEYKAAVFLFFCLNLILLLLNCIDVYWVWFNFEWEGQYLKQFVHEGTYLLILSILISIALVLYFFRKNLNFYTKNKTLKYLSYIWIAQNAILTISVGIRNLYYIEYFNLAYKRIGVILFLILTLYGLYSVFRKVRYKKSSFYILRTNAMAFYLVICISSIFNWDNIIAKYNFAHADRSFLHLNYMASLSDKSLPSLDKPLPDLLRIDSAQNKLFPFEKIYLEPEEFYNRIQIRKEDFKIKWEQKNFLSWNWPEYEAYRILFLSKSSEN